MNKKQDELAKKHSGVGNNDLFHLLMRCSKITETQSDAVLQSVNLTKAKLMALWVLVEYGEPVPLGELAEYLHSVRSNATQMVDRLEAEGLVQRVYDPKDRRVVLAQITEEGRRRYEEGKRVHLQLREQLIQQFTQEEQTQLITLLNRVVQTLS
jgi:DNA-binding MarR family transcriptional regulator